MSQIIDLTYEIEGGMPTFKAKWHPKVSIKKLGSLKSIGRESRKMILGTHTGTHIDAPSHFIDGGQTIDGINLNALFGPVKIMDFSNLKEGTELTTKMLSNFKISKRMIFRFGWNKHWKTKKFYSHHPYFSREAAYFLVENGINLLGYDLPSPDNGKMKLTKKTLKTDEDSPIHKIFLGNKIILIEYLTNLEKITDLKGWNIIAFPLKIKGADGAPARILIAKK